VAWQRRQRSLRAAARRKIAAQALAWRSSSLNPASALKKTAKAAAAAKAAAKTASEADMRKRRREENGESNQYRVMA